jgi:REP element-mobilizing transposase RayT
VTRVVERRFAFGAREKEKFVEMLRAYEDFCGVQVLTFCVMSNHVHVLVHVPKPPERMPDDAELVQLVRRAELSYPASELERQLAEMRCAGDDAGAERLRARFLRRMWNLASFMQSLKQRFSQWFNGRNERVGTLWEGRFKSVLVEGKGEPLHTMAAYIDLNPVRAGLVKDPKDYRWCGYAEALSGSRRAQRAMSKVTAMPVDGWESAGGAEAYRKLLFSHAVEVQNADQTEVVRRGVAVEQAKAVLEAKGKLTSQELVQFRVRYFSDGLVIGGKEFVEGIFGQHREKFGPKRKDGARRIAESAGGLFALRRLRMRAVE